MATAIDETNRRREIQVAYNKEHGIDPQPLRKRIADITDQLQREEEDTRELLAQRAAAGKKTAPTGKRGGRDAAAAAEQKLRQDGITAAPAEDLVDLIAQMTQQMQAAAEDLQFELAARIRDELSDLKKELRQMQQAGHA